MSWGGKLDKNNFFFNLIQKEIDNQFYWHDSFCLIIITVLLFYFIFFQNFWQNFL